MNDKLTTDTPLVRSDATAAVSRQVVTGTHYTVQSMCAYARVDEAFGRIDSNTQILESLLGLENDEWVERLGRSINTDLPYNLARHRCNRKM